MSISLQEALKQVELRAGETYRCQVNGFQVEVRVTAEDAEPDSLIPESDIMLEPWVELPLPPGGIIVKAKPGKLPPPDIPEIPSQDEYE